MIRLDIKQLNLNEGDLITKEVIDTIEKNMINVKEVVEQIESPTPLDNISDVIVSGATAEQVATTINEIIDALTAKGFMA